MQEFKKQVLNWLSDNKIYPKKVRVFNTKRYGKEVRIYLPPQEIPNSRYSVRKSSESSTGYYRGLFSRKISMYIHINEEDLKSENEKNFILEQCKNENI